MPALKSNGKIAASSVEDLARRNRQLEEALQRITSNFNRALEQGKAVVYSRNFESLVYEYMGENIEDITGYSAREMTPALFDSISIGTELQGELAGVSTEKAYQLNRSGKVNKWISDTQIRTKSGEIKYILDMSTGLRDDKGHFYGSLGILFDITERKHMEQELAKTTEELRQKNEEIERDIATARDIQLALLAHREKHFPLSVPIEKSAVRFYNLYIPARELSGDFFYILPISDHVVGLLIGDVMGHGVRASLITAFLRGLIEEIKPFAHENDVFLQKLNHGLLSVISSSHESSFVTAVYLTVDIHNRVVYCSNAGHPEPLFLNRATGPIPLPFTEKRKTEPALGLLENFPYSVASRRIVPEDVVYLYTDGTYEAKNSKEQFFGKERLLTFINSSYAKNPDDLLRELLKKIRRFAGPIKDFDDDLCMVAVHIMTPQI